MESTSKSEKSNHPLETPVVRITTEVASIAKTITIEPLLCFYLIGSLMCVTALTNLQLVMGCRFDLNFSDEICASVLTGTYLEKNFTTQNDEVQMKHTNMQAWQLPFKTYVPLVLILFLGSYSDRHKMRKPLLMVPMIGQLLGIVGSIFCVFFMNKFHLVVQTIFETVIPSLFGGSPVIVMACFAYIADVSTMEKRTLRIGVVQILIISCSMIAPLLGGIMFAYLGILGVFIIAGLLCSFGILCGIFMIQEPKKVEERNKKTNLCFNMFHFTHPWATIKLLFKNKALFLLMTILIIYSGITAGENSVLFFLSSLMYQWTIADYTVFIKITGILQFIGIAVGIALFTLACRVSDYTLMTLSFISKIIGNVSIMFLATSVGIYTGSIVSLIIGLISITIRSQATKVVSEDDFGKSLSLFAIIEVLAPLIVAPLYSKVVYGYTSESFPPAFLIFSISLCIMGMIMSICLHVKEKEKMKKLREANEIPMENGKFDTIHENTYF